MTDLRKAAEMALEALHNIDQSNNDDAIEALRQALAESANSTTDFVEPVAWIEKHKDYLAVSADPFENAIPVYTAPPKQEYQYEVVAEHADGTYTTRRIPKRQWVGLTNKEISELYLAAGIIPWTKHTVGPNSDIGDGVYTTPLVEDGMDGDGTCLNQFAQLIEVKLKEKNHG